VGGMTRETAALSGECRAIARDARRLLYCTRARKVRTLPGVERDRRRLLELMNRANALAARLERQPARSAPHPLRLPLHGGAR
jgi:hypothetical protein